MISYVFCFYVINEEFFVNVGFFLFYVIFIDFGSISIGLVVGLNVIEDFINVVLFIVEVIM